MSNTNVPGKPVLIRFDGDEAAIEWSTPARSGHTWSVYASLSGVPPLAGPPLAVDLRQRQFNVYAPLIPGNSPPVNDFYVAVTSTNTTTGQESAQGAPLLVSVASPTGGSDTADSALTAVDPSGKFSAVRVGTTGSLLIDSSTAPPPIGASTEAKQDTQIAQLTGVQTRQDSSLSQLNDIESKQDTQIVQLTGVQARQDSALAQLNDIEAKQDTQVTQLAGVHTRQDSALSQLNDIESKQDTQVTQLTGVQARQDSQLSQLNDIESKQDTQITQLTGVQTRQDNQLSQLNDIESKQDTQVTQLAGVQTKQDTQISSLSSLDTKTPAQGQATMAGSTPVVVASNQSSLPVNLSTGLDQKPAAQSQSVVLASEYTDPAARVRTSVPGVVFSDNIRTVKNPHAWGELVASGGTATMVGAEGAVDLATTTASGSRVVYQTKRFFHLAPSHGYRIVAKFLLGPAVTNNTRRLGCFTSSDGVFLERVGSVLRVVARSSASGSPVDTGIDRSAWNIDKLDGSGASGVNLDFANVQVLTIDVHPPSQFVVGFYAGGRFYQAHRFAIPNVSATPPVTGSVFPLAAENVNTAATSAVASLKVYSIALTSEGVHSVSLFQFSTDSGTAGLSVSSGNSAPLLSVRPRAGFSGSRILISQVSLINTNAADFRIRLVLNGTLTGATFATSTGLVSEADTAATAISGGTVLYTNYLTTATTGSSTLLDTRDLDIELSTAVDGTRDTLSVVVTAITNTNNTRTAMNWKEAV